MAFVITGCSLTAPPVPEENFYRLQAEFAQEPLSQVLLEGVLEVEPIAGEGLLRNRAIIYSLSESPNQLRTYHYNLWSETPSVMLSSELISFLRAAKVATQIVTPNMRVRSDYVLSGNIKRLERIVGKPNRSLIRVEFSIRSASRGKLLFLREYKLENSVNGEDLASTVNSLSTSLSVIASDFLEDLKGM